MKRTICLALSILFIFTFIGCNGIEEKEADPMHSTVYVSGYGKIHAYPSCSGMKHYTAMPADLAAEAGYTLCKKCYPSK